MEKAIEKVNKYIKDFTFAADILEVEQVNSTYFIFWILEYSSVGTIKWQYPLIVADGEIIINKSIEIK